MAEIIVDLGQRSYPIHLSSELPASRLLQELKRIRQAPAPVLVVSDDRVGALYADDVMRSLEAAGYVPSLVSFKAGEASKSLETLAQILDAGLAAALSRRDVIVALGGGVVGDLAGFAASILLRGVAYIQVPTTLLAQVDSAVGGKTAINHKLGKNLIGSFWQPKAVVSSQKVLETLDERERRCGLAEAIKHGLIGDREFTDWCVRESDALRGLEHAAIRHLVERCCRIKAAIVREDERESGRRALLNLGHTFGHAYERLLGYGVLTHGEAVALGMVWSARLSERLGVARAGLEDEVKAILKALGLPNDPHAEALPSCTELIAAARNDKKADQTHVMFILLEEIGRTMIRRLSWIDIEEALLGPPLGRKT